MGMTKKHYEETAAIFREQLAVIATDVPGEYEPVAYDALRSMADALAGMFGRDNPRFEKTRFLDASGFEYSRPDRQPSHRRPRVSSDLRRRAY